jgi:syntaxin-binding protein 5
LALHPRDIGTLLIGYAEGAVVYSFKQNKPLKFFRYELPRGAPGGDGDLAAASVVRHPQLTQALWHPTGTFILTGHEDGSLVFWDAKDGRIVMARTLTDTNVDKPSSMGMRSSTQGQGNAVVKEPLYKIVWCANEDPEDTAILISGGASSTSPAKGLTLLELGRTPVYATSSWQILSQYLESPKRQRMLPIPPNTEVIDFCLIPKSTPYFAGAHDPIAILALLGSGEIITMSFPSGFPISPTNQLHVSVTFVHPFITAINLSPIDRSKWLGMVEKRSKGPLILKGGAEALRPMKRFENRNIVQTAHADGTIRLWDAGHGDEIENESVLQVDVDRAVGRLGGVEITEMSLAGASGEFAVGTRSGEVVVFRWNRNRSFGREPPDSGPPQQGELIDITNRGDPGLSDGLLPYTMVDMQNGPVTALKASDVGFVAAGFQGGGIIVIDMRGPALIFNANLKDFSLQEKRGFGRHGSRPQPQSDYPTFMEFSVSLSSGFEMGRS